MFVLEDLMSEFAKGDRGLFDSIVNFVINVAALSQDAAQVFESGRCAMVKGLIAYNTGMTAAQLIFPPLM